jgi:hypothetical protein
MHDTASIISYAVQIPEISHCGASTPLSVIAVRDQALGNANLPCLGRVGAVVVGVDPPPLPPLRALDKSALLGARLAHNAALDALGDYTSALPPPTCVAGPILSGPAICGRCDVPGRDDIVVLVPDPGRLGHQDGTAACTVYGSRGYMCGQAS